MAKKWKKIAAVATSVVMASSIAAGLAGCGGLSVNIKPVKGIDHTYRDYLTVSPSNWNELTYEDNNDTEVLDWIVSSFFDIDFNRKADGTIITTENAAEDEAIFKVHYSAATNLEDVTSSYSDLYSAEQIAEGGYAYKITLRNDLKWDDGTPIDASDFVYTMQQQLDPAFKNYRADSYYSGATVIHNAKNYAYSGLKGWFSSDAAYEEYSTANDDKLIFTLNNASENKEKDGAITYFRKWFNSAYASYGYNTWAGERVAKNLGAILGISLPEGVAESMEGKTLAEIKADATMNAAWEAILGAWKKEDNEELHFFIAEKEFPTYKPEDIGLKVGANKYELVLQLDQPIELFDDNGEMGFKAAYNLGSLPLVKKDLYESCKQKPVRGSTLWTSNYNSSVKTSASWGPYKLTTFQRGKQFILERNENWFGYNMKEYEGQYQTDRIVYTIIDSWNTAWQVFQKGGIEIIGLDVTVADDYKNAPRTYVTPSDFVGSLQLQSSTKALTAEKGNQLLEYTEFREALSLAINRADFVQKCTTASKAGFGLFNGQHYYDIANSAAYRDQDVAKETLLATYGYTKVGDKWSDGINTYDTLDAAYNSVTGFNLALAKEKLAAAVAKAKEDGIDTTKVNLVFGTGAINETTQIQFDTIKGYWEKLFEGSGVTLTMKLEDHGEKWNSDYKAGAYDVCMGGWSGAKFDPGYMLLAYLDSNYMYSQGWDTANTYMTFTMPTVDGFAQSGKTIKMSLLDWYACLNGNASNYEGTGVVIEGEEETPFAFTSFADGKAPAEVRLALIAALEKEVLSTYYTLPLYNNYSTAIRGYKIESGTMVYNPILGYGGIRYITYNYTDAEWYDFVQEQPGHTIDYKF